MPSILTALATAFGLGFFYFVGATPAGIALGLPPWAAVLTAWIGYTAGAAIMLVIPQSARDALRQRLKISPDPKKLIWRIWDRFGVVGLGLLAPFTVGPQASMLIGLSLGVSPIRMLTTVSLASLPSAIVLATLVAFGFSFGK